MAETLKYEFKLDKMFEEAESLIDRELEDHMHDNSNEERESNYSIARKIFSVFNINEPSTIMDIVEEYSLEEIETFLEYYVFWPTFDASEDEMEESPIITHLVTKEIIENNFKVKSIKKTFI